MTERLEKPQSASERTRRNDLRKYAWEQAVMRASAEIMVEDIVEAARKIHTFLDEGSFYEAST